MSGYTTTGQACQRRKKNCRGAESVLDDCRRDEDHELLLILERALVLKEPPDDRDLGQGENKMENKMLTKTCFCGIFFLTYWPKQQPLFPNPAHSYNSGKQKYAPYVQRKALPFQTHKLAESLTIHHTIQ